MVRRILGIGADVLESVAVVSTYGGVLGVFVLVGIQAATGVYSGGSMYLFT